MSIGETWPGYFFLVRIVQVSNANDVFRPLSFSHVRYTKYRSVGFLRFVSVGADFDGGAGNPCRFMRIDCYPSPFGGVPDPFRGPAGR